MHRFRAYVRAQALAGMGALHTPPDFRAMFDKAAAYEIEYGRHQLWPGFFTLLGAALYFVLPFTPPAILLFVLSAIAVLFAIALRHTFAPFAIAVCILSFLLGAIAADLQTRRVASPLIHEDIKGAKITGTVTEVEHRIARRPRITLAVIDMEGRAQADRPGQLRLTGKKLGELAEGDTVKVEANLHALPLPTNPGAYDPSFFWFFDGMDGTGTVSKQPEKILRQELSLLQTAQIWLTHMRANITQRVQAGLNGETGAIAASLITGDRSGISDDLYQAFNGSGLIHVLSISGLHMVLVAGGMFFLSRLLFACLGLIFPNIQSKKLAALCAIAVVSVYEIISGGAVATTRSYIMILIVFGAILLDRPALTMRNVVIAAMLIALWMPNEILSASFQMSFAATAALIAAHERKWFPRVMPWNDSWLATGLSWLVTLVLVTFCTSLVAELATAPFTLHHFHRISTFGVIGNLLALIFIELAVMPGVLLTLFALPFGLENFTLPFLGFGIDGMMGVARLVSSFPHALVGISGFGITSMLLCSFGIVWASLWKSRIAVLALVPYAVGLLLGIFEKPADLYISQSGWSMAVRGPDEKLTLLHSPREIFIARRWLEADGDRREIDDPALKLNQNCDSLGCAVYSRKAGLIAISYDQASLAEDCARADLLILPRAKAPPQCTRPQLVIDRAMIREGRGISVKFSGEQGAPQFTLRSITQDCGARPWCPEAKTISQE